MKKNLFKFTIITLILTAVFLARPALAVESDVTATSTDPVILDTTTSTPIVTETAPELSTSTRHITLRIEGPDSTILDTPIDTPENCYIQGANETTSTLKTGFMAVCALQKAVQIGLLQSYTINLGSWGYSLDAINNIPGSGNFFWSQNVNYMADGVGIDQQELKEGDIFLLGLVDWTKANTNPIFLTASTSTLNLGEKLQINLQYYNFDWTTFINSLTNLNASTTLHINQEPTPLEISSSSFTYQPTATGTLTIWAESDGMIRSAKINVTVNDEIITTTTTPSTDNSQNQDSNPPVVSGGGPGVQQPNTNSTFNVINALQYLSAQQNNDGSIVDNYLSDIAALAYGSTSSGEVAQKLKNYYLQDPALTLGSNISTDYSRRAMALMALGINPYSDTKTNYITKLLSTFDGTQFQDINQCVDCVNDDIFALLVLTKAGYTTSDDVIAKIIAYILSKQDSQNGNWTSVDMTAAAIQALSTVKEYTGVNDALNKGAGYLHSKQNTNGSFSNSGFSPEFSSIWTMPAIRALNQDDSNWTVNGNTPGSYLASIQNNNGSLNIRNTDGSLSTNTTTVVKATSYAVAAASRQSWPEILQSFTKPQVQGGQNSGANYIDVPVTTTTLISTTTLHMPVIVSTTVELISTTTTIITDATSATTTITLTPPNPQIQVAPKRVAGIKIKRIQKNDIQKNTIVAAETVAATVTPEKTNATPVQPQQLPSENKSFTAAIQQTFVKFWQFLKNLM